MLPLSSRLEAAAFIQREVEGFLSGLKPGTNSKINDEEDRSGEECSVVVKGARSFPCVYKVDTSSPKCKWEAADILLQHLLQNGFSEWVGLVLSERISQKCLPELSEMGEGKCVSRPRFADAVLLHLPRHLEEVMQDLRDTHLPHSFPLPHSVSVCAIKNARRKMEDRHVIVPSLSLLHPKPESATYAATHLLDVLMSSGAVGESPREALIEAFHKLDKQLCAKCEAEKLRSGCTAVVALFRGGKLFLAWAGDSQAGLCRGNQQVSMITEPHNPHSEKEYERIEAEGGVLMCVQGELRVNGVLNVSRSLGDALLKPVLSGEPDIVEVELAGTEDFLLLGCDGLWDSLGTQECLQVVKEFVHNHPLEEYHRRHVSDFGDMARSLVEKAKSNGSSDNITALFVYLRDPADLWMSFR